MYYENEKYSDIAKSLNYCYCEIVKKITELIKNKILIKRARIKMCIKEKPYDNKIRNLYLSGVEIISIAHSVKCDEKTVSNRLNKMRSLGFNIPYREVQIRKKK